MQPARPIRLQAHGCAPTTSALSQRPVAHLSDDLSEWIKFASCWRVGCSEPEVPADDIGDEVGELNAGRQVAVAALFFGGSPQ